MTTGPNVHVSLSVFIINYRHNNIDGSQRRSRDFGKGGGTGGGGGGEGRVQRLNLP